MQFHMKNINSNESEIEFVLNNNKAGVYLVKFTSETEVLFGKFILIK